jgi:hypothetical protein
VLDAGDSVVEPVDRFLAHLSAVDRSPQTVRSYAFDLRDLFAFLLQPSNQPKGTASELLDDQTGELARWSRLSESNRRPSHYEEELQRLICSLPALLATQMPPASAGFPMRIRRFVPRVMPYIPTTLGRGLRLVGPDQVHRPTF